MSNLERLEDYKTRIGDLPKLLKATVEHLSDSQLDTPYREDGWTIRQVVHHLVDSHINGYIRFKMILTEDNPELKPYDQDKWAQFPDAKNLPINVSINILEGLHYRWTYFLNDLNEDDLIRTAYHPEEGDISFIDYLKLYALHGEKHLGHINGIKEIKGW